MKLGTKSQKLLKRATRSVGGLSEELSAACASTKLCEEECYRIATSLRVAASDIEEIGGRLFYAKQRKHRK